jgi:hypothetical protein
VALRDVWMQIPLHHMFIYMVEGFANVIMFSGDEIMILRWGAPGLSRWP